MLDHWLLVTGGAGDLGQRLEVAPALAGLEAVQCVDFGHVPRPETCDSRAVMLVSGDDVHDDDFGAVGADLVAAVVLGAAGVGRQADQERCCGRDQYQLNCASHLYPCS